MPKFKEAYFKAENKNISIEEYIDKLHYERIYCPECLTAPLHIVRKQKRPPYYASNSKQEHLEDCQHYEDYIPNRSISKLIKSDEVEDRERLNFLIKNNLQGAINLLIKKEEKENNIVQFRDNKHSNTSQVASSNKYKKESIPRVSINRLFGKKEECLDNYVIIWGNADIETKEKELVNSNTKEKFTVKQLVFRVKNKFRFSISISGNKLRYYTNLKDNPMNKDFAVFGLLKENKGKSGRNFLELKVLTTRHMQFI